MKIRTLGWLVGLSAIASSFLSCSQATVACVVGHAGSGVAYIAQYSNPTDAPAGCGMKSQLQVQSLVWQSLYNVSQNADPPRDACKTDSKTGKTVLVSDPTKPCDPPFCAADTDCNSKHCTAVVVACAANADCASNQCLPTPCMMDADCSDPMDHCVVDPNDPTMMAKICENENVCGPNEKYCDLGDPPATDALNTLTGDQIGMETYHPPTVDPADPMNKLQPPDFSQGTVAIQVDSTGNLGSWSGAASVGTEADPMNDHPYAIGKWTSEQPDANDFCTVPSLAPAVQKFTGVDTTLMPPMQVAPEQDFNYDWKNVQIYVTAAAQGTQFSADLTYTQVDHTDVDPTKDTSSTCAVTYHVRGLWPAIPCWVPDPSKDPRYTDQPMVDKQTGKLVVDQTLCCPNACPPGKCGALSTADPMFTRAIGSGISPDFPVKCDDVLGYCVLDAPADAKVPVLNAPGAKPNTDLCGTSE